MKLADIIEEWISGDWGSEQSSTEVSEKVYCLRSADISPIYNAAFDTAAVRYISTHSLSRNQLKEGDIVIEKSGGTNSCSTGRVILITKDILAKNTPLVCSNFCAAFRVKENWDSAFVYYYFRLIHRSGVFLNFEGKTSGIHNLLIDTAFATIDFPDVDLSTQKRIASVLSNIDRKIALNRAMNEELEQTARDLYDYWFLQFDFPDANGKPYRSSGGKMVYNPQLKREIPQGWEVLKVANLCQPNKRTSNGKFSTSFQYLDISNITENHIEELQKLDPCVDNIPSRARRLVTEGDIVYSTVRPNLRHYGLLYNPIENMVVSTGFAVLTSNWSGYRYYLYQFLSHPMIVNKLHTIAQLSVSAYPSISVNDILELDILVPSKDIVGKYAEFCNNVYAQMDIQEKEIVHLRSLRDELLPLLMNGQVEVKE